jgi:ABC transporter substrate binding protein
MKRRELITLLGGAAAAWPLAARAQQGPMPVIGFLGSASPDRWAGRMRAFHQGLRETGYVEGRDGLLVNPTNPNLAEPTTKNLQAAARTLGLQLHVLHASTEHDFDTVFATLVQLHAGALVIGADPFFSSRLEQLALLTVRHAVPTVYQSREFTAAGGLMSYGANFTDTFRAAGVYTGRILKGDKPADLPGQQLVGLRRAQDYARDHRRQAQPGDQRRARRCQDQGAARRAWRHRARRLLGRLRQAHRRREVG